MAGLKFDLDTELDEATKSQETVGTPLSKKQIKEQKKRCKKEGTDLVNKETAKAKEDAAQSKSVAKRMAKAAKLEAKRKAAEERKAAKIKALEDEKAAKLRAIEAKKKSIEDAKAAKRKKKDKSSQKKSAEVKQVQIKEQNEKAAPATTSAITDEMNNSATELTTASLDILDELRTSKIVAIDIVPSNVVPINVSFDESLIKCYESHISLFDTVINTMNANNHANSAQEGATTEDKFINDEQDNVTLDNNTIAKIDTDVQEYSAVRVKAVQPEITKERKRVSII